MSELQIIPFTYDHHDFARDLLAEHMMTHLIVSRGVLYNPLEYPGFVALLEDELIGLVTYRIEGDQCEILTLHSKKEDLGVGGALVEQVKKEAQMADCKRLWLITTNDNIHAIRWYQRRGFTIAAVHVNALELSRTLKHIPPLGFDNIPLRDEIEFEIFLQGRDNG